MRFEAIIFDFDGVIADSEVVANSVMAERLTAIGLQTSYEEALDAYCGRQWSHCLDIIQGKLGRPVPKDFLPGFYREARARHVETMTAISGLDAFLEAHAARRRAIASSNDRDWLLGCVERMGLADWFGAHVYSGADLERGKPHPDIFLHAARALDAEAARVIVIEDSAIGVEAGAAAGMTVIGLLAGGHIRDGHGERLRAAGAHHVARDYNEAERIVAALES